MNKTDNKELQTGVIGTPTKVHLSLFRSRKVILKTSCGLIVILLILAVITIGCDNPYDVKSYSAYTLHDGTKTACSTLNNSCGSDFYQAYSNGDVRHCQNAVVINCPLVPGTTNPKCVPNYSYTHLKNEGISWVVISSQQDQNSSTVPAQVTFTSTTSKTVTVTDKLDIIANLNATVAGDAGILIGIITADVKAEINHEVTQTVNATIGNAYSTTIPAGETAYANYGVKVQATSGNLSDKAMCGGQKSNWGTDITYVPLATGWCVWLSNQTPCSSVS